MLSNNETNSNVVEIQQLQQQNNSTPSPEGSLEQKMELLGKEIKSLRKQNLLNSGISRLGVIGLIGYIIATNWSAIAAAAQVIGIAIGAIIGAAVLVGASYAIWKYRAQIKEGFKYAAEKTVDGAKHIGGKIRDGAVHTKDSVKEAVSSVEQATKEGTSSALRAMGDGVQKFGRKMSNIGVSMSSLDSIPYSIGNEGQTVVLKTEEKTRNFNSVKEMFIKEVLEDKAVNSSALTKEIFSKLGEKILEKAYSVDGQSGFQKDQLINRLEQQVDFVNKLDAKKLQNLLSKDNNSLYEIFSEHHDEIKRIIGECKREYEFDQSVRRNNAKDVEERKASKSFSLPSFSSLGRKGSEQSNSLSESSSMSSLDSARTDSTISSEAELLNPAEHKKVKQSSGFFSRFKRNEPLKEATDIKYQVFSESDTLSIQVGESTFCVAQPNPPRSSSPDSIGTVSADAVSSSGSKDFATVKSNRLRRSSSSSCLTPKLTPAAPPKVPGSPSVDSGMGSGSSTPTRKQVLPLKEEFDRKIEEKLAKRRASLDQPSAEPVNSRATATPGTV